jgi:hypothetical protein
VLFRRENCLAPLSWIPDECREEKAEVSHQDFSDIKVSLEKK